jgi:hypothetical protein
MITPRCGLRRYILPFFRLSVESGWRRVLNEVGCTVDICLTVQLSLRLWLASALALIIFCLYRTRCTVVMNLA